MLIPNIAMIFALRPLDFPDEKNSFFFLNNFLILQDDRACQVGFVSIYIHVVCVSLCIIKIIVMQRLKGHLYRRKEVFYRLLDMLYHLEGSKNHFEKKYFFLLKNLFSKKIGSQEA
jgi:hypothetical protein